MDEETICKHGVFKLRHLAGSCNKLRPHLPTHSFFLFLFLSLMDKFDQNWLKTRQRWTFLQLHVSDRRLAGGVMDWTCRPVAVKKRRVWTPWRTRRGIDFFFLCQNVNMMLQPQWMVLLSLFLSPFNFLVAPMTASTAVGSCFQVKIKWMNK